MAVHSIIHFGHFFPDSFGVEKEEVCAWELIRRSKLKAIEVALFFSRQKDGFSEIFYTKPQNLLQFFDNSER